MMLDQHRLLISLVRIVVVKVHEMMQPFDTYLNQD